MLRRLWNREMSRRDPQPHHELLTSDSGADKISSPLIFKSERHKIWCDGEKSAESLGAIFYSFFSTPSLFAP